MSNAKAMKAKPVKLTLSDGKEYEVKYTLNSLAELEEQYGSVEEAFKKLDSNSIKAARFFLWAGLIWDKPDLTELDVGNLFDVREMSSLVDSLGQAFEKDMPSPEQIEDLNQEGQSPNV